MSRNPHRKTLPASIAGLLAATLLSASAFAIDIKVTLSGDAEVPAVKSAGTGSGFFAISSDRKITGQINVSGIKPTAAHIHEAPAGASGPVIVPLVRAPGTDTFNVPPNQQLSDAQMSALQAGRLYVNVHTEANPGGEIRGQLKP